MMLFEFLRDVVLSTGMKQVELARISGLSPKHVNQMLRHGVGAVKAWDRLLLAAGVTSMEPKP